MHSDYNYEVEESLLLEAEAFPYHRFMNISGHVNMRKIKQLHPDFQQDALNLIFIRKAVSVHHNTYGYALVEYKSMNQYVYIICKEHGRFKQTARVHIAGSGCQQCAIARRAKKAMESNLEGNV